MSSISLAANGLPLDPAPQAPLVTAQQIALDEQLKLLALFHYVLGAIYFLFGLVAGGYMGGGVAIWYQQSIKPAANSNPGDAVVGLVFLIWGALLLLVGWLMAGMSLYAARSIQRRRARMLSLIMAALDCLFFPIGTALGACTLVVLIRDSARVEFGELAPSGSLGSTAAAPMDLSTVAKEHTA